MTLRMVTDDERREVAERLRGISRDVKFWGGVDPLHYVKKGVFGDVDRHGPNETIDRLADLIDPDCDEGRYEGLRTVRPVDREALLELADALEDGFGMTGSPSAAQLKVLAGINVELRAYARIIREALGVES